MKIHWLSNHPSNYQIYLFNSLSENSSFDLKIYFLLKESKEHPWKEINKIKFNYKFFTFNNWFDQDLTNSILSEKNSLFIIANWSHSYAIFILNLLTLLRRNFVIWTDTPNIERERGLIKRILRNNWLKYIVNKSNFIMGTGEVALKAFNEMGFDKTKYLNFPYFINLKKFSRENQLFYNPQKDKLIFFSSGRLNNAHKGYDLALKALKIYKEKKDFSNFCYRIAGEGRDKEKLKLLVERLNIENNVEFLGWLGENELVQYYNTSHIFLHPSHFDPWGVAVLEAMACGLTVIGSDKAGCVVDRIYNFKNGLIHKDGDENDLAEKLIYLFDNPEKMNEYGVEARKTSELWGIQKAHNIIEHITEQLV